MYQFWKTPPSRRIEPPLHHNPVTGEGARLNWYKGAEFLGQQLEKCLLNAYYGCLACFDVRFFNSHAPLNNKSSTNACNRRHEREKRRAYEWRLHEAERSTFTPSVLSTSGGVEHLQPLPAKESLLQRTSNHTAQPYSTLGSYSSWLHNSIPDNFLH